MPLSVGLKADADARPQTLLDHVKNGTVDLNDPATTVALLKLNAVDSTVDKSFSTSTIPSGNIGKRLDGWPNRDLNVGAIVSLSQYARQPGNRRCRQAGVESPGGPAGSTRNSFSTASHSTRNR